MRFIVAIDGTCASGKSTTARIAAIRMKWLFLDTGAMYRAVAFETLRRCVDPEDEKKVSKIAGKITIAVKSSSDGQRTFIGNEDISRFLRTPEIDRAVTPVSKFKKVRERMVYLQRKIGSEREIICEGRDMGTVVFPDAELKIYMDANLETRALRRQKEIQEKGIFLTLEEIKKDLRRRDFEDSSREESPLKMAADAIMLDTTKLTIDQEVDWVIKKIKERYKDDLAV